MNRDRGDRVLRVATGVFLPPLALLLVVEVVLRLLSVAPSGQLAFLVPTSGPGLYPPNATIEQRWGQFNYTVETNELGLRASGAPRPLRQNAKRIATIGDSVTDGFFVNNDGTFQHFLQRRFDESYGGAYQVLNVARGGGSIDMELAVLEEVAVPLKPEVVILTFVTNDISDLRGKERDALFNYRIPFHRRNAGVFKTTVRWVLSNTAVGEVAFRLYFNQVIKKRASQPDPQGDASDYAANVEVFRGRYATDDGMVLQEELSGDAQDLLTNYLLVLEVFVRECREHGITPVFVYFPAYPQVYDWSASMNIQTILAGQCERLEIPFLDLSPALRFGGKGKVLHNAPLDFHLNPAGNDVIAQAMFDFLVVRELVQ